MELLQLLSWSKKPLSLKELSAQCGYPKSTVFGLLTTMRTYDVVTQTPDGKYSLDCLRCVGACGLAPVVMIGEKVYGRLQPVDVKKIIEELE